MASRKEQKERARQERLAAERAAAAQAARRRRLQLGGGVGVAVVVGVVVAIVAATSGGSSNNGSENSPRVVTTSINTLGHLRPVTSEGPLGPELVPLPQVPPLTSAAGAASGQTVDGIQCQAGEQTVFHVHSHLTIFVNGTARQIPYGIGIPGAQVSQSAQGPFVGSGSCFYWLHTHAADGIVHIESPVRRTYTLGDFFDIWHQPLGRNQVGPMRGKVTAFYNGKPYTADPRHIPLGNHIQVQLDVGTPLIAPEKISFAGTGL